MHYNNRFYTIIRKTEFMVYTFSFYLQFDGGGHPWSEGGAQQLSIGIF